MDGVFPEMRQQLPVTDAVSYTLSPLLQWLLGGAVLFSPFTHIPLISMLPRVTKESCHRLRGVRAVDEPNGKVFGIREMTLNPDVGAMSPSVSLSK